MNISKKLVFIGVLGLSVLPALNCFADEGDDSLATIALIQSIAGSQTPAVPTICGADDIFITDDVSSSTLGGTSYGNGTAIQTNNASVNKSSTSNCIGTFQATNWTINPALPTGLTLNTSSGAISGTPGAVSTRTSYTRSATINVTLSQDGETTNNSFTETRSISLTVATNTAAVTCNSVGTFPGCGASFPFSCSNEPFSCFSSYSGCRRDPDCNYYL